MVRPTVPVRRICQIGLFLVCAALSQRVARGSELPTVVLVADNADASIIAVLRAELTALGLQALVVPRADRGHEMSSSELTEAAGQNHAIAALRVLVEERKVEVWLTDRKTGKILLREVLMSKDSEQSQTDDSTVVARAVELLRASLLELDIDGRSRGDVRAPASVRTQPAPPQHETSPARSHERVSRYGVSVGAEVLAATSHAAVSSGLGVTLQWYPFRHWGLIGHATVPFNQSRYAASQGTANVSPYWASLGLRYRVGEWPDRWQIWLDSGVGLLLTDSVGSAGAGYVARSSFDIDPVVYGGAAVSYSLSQAVAMTVGSLGGPGLVPTRIMFGDQVIDHYGQWLMIVHAGLNLTWE